jgi:DNA-directed RNA polymerase subunit RPC12/RpoP
LGDPLSVLSPTIASANTMSVYIDTGGLTSYPPRQSNYFEGKIDPLMDEPSSMQSQPGPEPSTPTKSFLKPTSPARLAARPDTFRDFEESSRPGKRARLNPPPMTAKAAMAESQQSQSSHTSPNPQAEALGALIGIPKKAMSKAPASTGRTAAQMAATTMSEPLTVVAANLQHPEGISGESQAQTSPVSISSLGTIETVTAPSAVATTVHSPSPMEDSRQTPHPEGTESTSPDNKAFSYPTPLLPQLQGERRHMSLPHSGLRQGSPRSPAKKHRCPYCSTEFTRHHNLKSHLLTHSQEKPYVCSTCQSRFRRLHDLKRHTKLHTGERPHTCPKCGRKFARGDALARHNKGPGGCAGRRSSMGSLNGDEDYEGNEDSMDGVVYGEPDAMDDEEGNERRPGIRRHAASVDDREGEQDHFSRLPSTYPPIQGRPPGGIASGIFPPRSNYAGAVPSSSAASSGASLPFPHPTSSASNLHSHTSGSGSAAIFSQNPISESPKPSSPGQTHGRSTGHIDSTLHARSPSTTSQLATSAPFSRGSGGRSASGPSIQPPPGAPQLPPPHGLNPPDARYTLPSQGGPAHPPTQPSGPPTHMSGGGPLSSHSNSLSSHGQGSGENVAGGSMFPSKEERLWAIVKSLEQRMNSMQEELNGLRAQLATATGQGQLRMA